MIIRDRRPLREVSRLEALSDAVFGFAATLLVVSLEVPRTLPELMGNLRGFVPFAFTFTMLILIWVAHNGFFRRYGLQDPWTIALNSILLFVVLFYIYPLKFLASALWDRFFGFAEPGAAPMVRSREEMLDLMVIYGIGFVAVFSCLTLLYRRASAMADELGLDEVGRIEARFWSYHYLIHVAVGLLSVAVAWYGGSPAVAGFLYVLLGPLCQWNGVIAGRRSREAAGRLATGTNEAAER